MYESTKASTSAAMERVWRKHHDQRREELPLLPPASYTAAHSHPHNTISRREDRSGTYTDSDAVASNDCAASDDSDRFLSIGTKTDVELNSSRQATAAAGWLSSYGPVPVPHLSLQVDFT